MYLLYPTTKRVVGFTLHFYKKAAIGSLCIHIAALLYLLQVLMLLIFMLLILKLLRNACPLFSFFHMHCKLIERNLDSCFIELKLDLFQHSPSCSPVCFCLHPCTQSDHDTAVSQFIHKDFNLLILYYILIIQQHSLDQTLCLFQISIIGDSDFQI